MNDILASLANGGVAGFSRYLRRRQHCDAAFDDYCLVALAENERRSLSDARQAVGERNGNFVRGRRGFRHGAVV